MDKEIIVFIGKRASRVQNGILLEMQVANLSFSANLYANQLFKHVNQEHTSQGNTLAFESSYVRNDLLEMKQIKHTINCKNTLLFPNFMNSNVYVCQPCIGFRTFSICTSRSRRVLEHFFLFFFFGLKNSREATRREDNG